MRLSSDIDLLVALCRSEFIGRKIRGIGWAFFADQLTLDLEGANGAELDISLGPIGWTLLKIPSREVIASNLTDSFEKYSLEAERLVGSTIANFYASAENDLALDLEFDCGLLLRTEPCGPVDPEDPIECWSFSCSDDHVIIVGTQQGKWGRIHKDQPFSDIFEMT